MMQLAVQPTSEPPPIEHYNYDEIDIFCHCELCSGYFRAAQDFQRHTKVTTAHQWHCRCELCALRRTAHIDSLAKGSRRDVYSELSFLAHRHPYGPRFLRWVLHQIRNPNFKSNIWWATHSHKKPLNAWMHEWQRTHLSYEMIAVSGLF